MARIWLYELARRAHLPEVFGREGRRTKDKHQGRLCMKARRLVSAAAFVLLLCVAVPTAFAGDLTDPWGVAPPNSLVADVLDAAVAGLNAALTVL